MKLNLSLILMLCGIFTAVAQTGPTVEKNANTINFEKSSRTLHGYDMKNFNRPKSAESVFANSGLSVSTENTAARDGQLDVEPFGQIDVNRWGVISNIETGGEVLFSSERIGNNFNVKTYNDDIEVHESFSVEIPANANQAEVLNHYSTNFFSNDGNGEFLIYLHYFDDDIPGPEGQIWEIWVVDANGNILSELNGFAAEAKVDSEGNHILFTYFDNDEDVIINKYDDFSSWEISADYIFPSELVHFFMGSPFDFITVDGVEYIVLAHYRILFMDNMTMEVFPDNNLIVKLLDFDFQEVKSMSFDIETRYPDAGEFTIPMAEFGMFYRDNTYDISSDIFNPDDKLEVVYGIYYYDMIADNEWSTYIVANEDGEILHELNEYIIDSFTEMNSIDGQDNQLGFLMGENGMATNLGFFNIESWEFDHIFDAVTSGDQLSANFNRIPSEDSFNYLIGLGEPDEENSNIYGVVGEYNRNGSIETRHRFLLPDDVVLFTPILTRYALIPNLFMPDDELYFMYTYKEMRSSGSIFNNVVISKSSESPLVEFRGDTAQGNIIGSTFLTDGNGTFNKMTLQYEDGNDQLLTDFYRLPFDDALGVEDQAAINFLLYPNPTNGVLNIQSNVAAQSIQIYGITGNLILNESLESSNKSVDLSFLSQGIYIAKVTLQNGSSQQVKFIKK